MTFGLRPYQEKAVADIREAFANKKKRVLLVSPTGSGKTRIFAFITHGAMKKNNSTLILVHRQELLDQTSKSFTELGIRHGLIAPKHSMTDDLIQIASIQTLVRRLDKIRPPNFIIGDESHHMVSAINLKVLNAFPETKVLGVTATPSRLDNRGLGEVFDHMVLGPSPAELIRDKWLSPYVVYGPPSNLDLSGVHKRGGDLDKHEVADAIDRSSIMGDAVSHYLRLLSGQQAIAFCPSIKHSMDIAAQFRASGIPAEHIDGGTDKNVRKNIIQAFSSGQIKVLASVDLIGEGFDVPAVAGVILLRPTTSTALHLQMIGRALRTAEGKEKAIIVDHVGNVMNLGLPDEERVWTLEGIKKKPKNTTDEVSIKQCPACYAVSLPSPSCPACGHVYQIKERKIDRKDGDLVELNIDKVAAERSRREAIKARAMEEGMAKTLDELVALAKSRNYANPYGWARLRIMQRKKKSAA